MAVITSAVIAGAGAIYGVASAEDQKKNARSAKIKAEDQGRELEKEAKIEEENQAGREEARKKRDAAASKQRAGAAEKQGRQGTILGGAPGAGESTNIAGSTDTKSKSLLGV